MKHSHSRHQKTTSNLLRIHVKGKCRFSIGSPPEGAMYINLWSNFRGHPKFFSSSIFTKYWLFLTKQFTGLLELMKLYKQNLKDFFFFTIYQNYTLALRGLIFVFASDMRRWSQGCTWGKSAVISWSNSLRTNYSSEASHRKNSRQCGSLRQGSSQTLKSKMIVWPLSYHALSTPVGLPHVCIYT